MKLFANLSLVTTNSHILFFPKDFEKKKLYFPISSAALCKNARLLNLKFYRIT
jgi:hypothetical protein